MKESVEAYYNQNHGFELEMTQGLAVYENYNKSLVTFIFQDQQNPEIFVDNINITKSNQNSNTKLDIFLEYSLKSLKKIINDFILMERGKIEINGREAVQIIYTGNIQGKNLKWFQIIIALEGSIYVLTYSSKMETFECNLNRVIEMFYTFNHSINKMSNTLTQL